MKIAIVAPEHPNTPQHGGIARYLKDYIPALATQHDVTLISVENGEPLPGIPQEIVAPCPLPSPLAPPLLSRAINQILRSLKPDVVEYTNWGGLGCLDTMPWARIARLSTPVAHGNVRPGILPRLAHPLHCYWESRTVRNTDLWISNTDENLKTCEKVYSMKQTSVTIPHGVKLPILEIKSDFKDILFVGRFQSRKGVDVLLEAWGHVCRNTNYDGRVLHLVGRDMPGRSKSYLQDSLDVIPPILARTFQIHGELDNYELDVLRAKCSIAVIPSRYESFGMVALEAFAAGHAVVASHTGGLQEVVEDGESGLLFANESAESLAKVLLEIITDCDLQTKLATGGQAALHGRFSMEQMVSKSTAAYEQAIELAAARQAGTEEVRP